MKEEKKKLANEREKYIKNIMKEKEKEIDYSFNNTIYYNSFHDFEFTKKLKRLSKNSRKDIQIYNLDTVKVTAAISAVASSKSKIAILDFASYKKPGGGFLNGSTAQEEDICSKSTLYPILKLFEPIYKRRKGNKGEYGDDMFYVPKVWFKAPLVEPLIKIPLHSRSDLSYDDYEKEEEFFADVIVSAAPNAKILRQHCDERYINRILFKRIECIFKVAIANKVSTLILGAYGTGVFDNDIFVVATAFKECCDMYHEYFENIIFAIPDKKKVKIFREVFYV